MGKGKGLKAALQTQQNRLKAKEKLSHAKQIAEDKLRRRGKVVAQSSASNISSSLSDRCLQGKKTSSRNPIIPFKTSDRILLIGEGNFSFTRALIDHPPRELEFLPPENITATAYDTEEECFNKYPECADIITFLRDRGVEVIFGVDATRLERHPALKSRTWDRIVWNFPHAGKGISDQDRNILSNQVLILGFLRSAAKMLQRGSIPGSSRKKKQEDSDEEGDNISLHSVPSEMDEECPPFVRGTVLITLRNVVPYTHWDIPGLAKNPPAPTGSAPPNAKYILLRSFRFYRNIWKGYEHRMTKGERAHGTGTTGGGEDRTWEFCLDI